MAWYTCVMVHTVLHLFELAAGYRTLNITQITTTLSGDRNQQSNIIQQQQHYLFVRKVFYWMRISRFCNYVRYLIFIYLCFNIGQNFIFFIACVNVQSIIRTIQAFGYFSFGQFRLLAVSLLSHFLKRAVVISRVNRIHIPFKLCNMIIHLQTVR